MNLKTIGTSCISLILTSYLFSSAAFATLITHEFNNGDSLSEWETDRNTPNGFEIINNELVMTISEPEGQTDFYNTKGMQLQIDNANFLSIDMFIDSNWTNRGERYGGLWAIGYSEYFETEGWGNKTYPILEYQVNSDGIGGIATWDSWNGWGSTLNTLFNMNQFNNFKFIIDEAGVNYFINDQHVFTDTLTQTEYFTGVILNAKYEGSDFMVKYDNLTYGNVSVPEPSTLAIFALGLVGLTSRRIKK